MAVLTGPAWMGLTTFIDFVSTFFSIPINCFLLYCIVTKSGKTFGRYKHLMAWFSIQSLFFTFAATLTHMCFHTIGGTFMMFTVSNHLHLPSWGVWVLLGICCISVGYVLLILSTQFVYRYIAMNSDGNLKYFSGWRRLYFVFMMLLVAVVYGGCGFVGINLTPERDKFIRESMAQTYGVTPEQIHYVAVEYFVRDKNDQRVWNFLSIGTAVMLNLLFGSMVVVIIYCGMKTYKVTHANTSNLSNHMYIHKQLFTALLVQTLTPTILIFIPCIFFYFLPIFEIPLGVDSNILSISLVLYPVIDPIGVLFIIKQYRFYLKKCFNRRVIGRARCSVLELQPTNPVQRPIRKNVEDSVQELSCFDSIQN